MSRFAHSDLLDNGPNYLINHCDKVVLTSQYDTTYTGCNSTYKVAQANIVSGDFSLAGVAGAARTLTASIAGKSGGNVLLSVNPGTGMHIAFLDTVAGKVLLVTEESSDQAATSGNPVTFANNVNYQIPQPTA